MELENGAHIKIEDLHPKLTKRIIDFCSELDDDTFPEVVKIENSKCRLLYELKNIHKKLSKGKQNQRSKRQLEKAENLILEVNSFRRTHYPGSAHMGSQRKTDKGASPWKHPSSAPPLEKQKFLHLEDKHGNTVKLGPCIRSEEKYDFYYEKDGISLSVSEEYKVIHLQVGALPLVLISFDERKRITKIENGLGTRFQYGKGLIEAALSRCKDLPLLDQITEELNLSLTAPRKEFIDILDIFKAYGAAPKPEAWNTTDPNHHNLLNFRYIVYAIPGELQKTYASLRALVTDPLDMSFEFDSVLHSELFLKRDLISCSVVDQTHTATWTGAGFILNVPESNILNASSSDMGTSRKRRPAKNPNLPPATKILEESSMFRHNEVAVAGHSEAADISIIGGFVKVHPGTELSVDTSLAAQIFGFCNSHNLPVVLIPDYSIRQKPSFISGIPGSPAFYGTGRYRFDGPRY